MTRRAARAAGLTHYYTGKPCKHGHHDERRLQGGCVACEVVRIRRLAEETREARARAGRPMRQPPWSTEKLTRAEIAQRWREHHPGQSAANAKSYRTRRKLRLARTDSETRTLLLREYQEVRSLLDALNERAMRHGGTGTVGAWKGKVRQWREDCATPPWVSPEDLHRVYGAALSIVDATRQAHGVGHVIPLRGECVSGLHVPANLCVLPARECEWRALPRPWAAPADFEAEYLAFLQAL